MPSSRVRPFLLAATVLALAPGAAGQPGLAGPEVGALSEALRAEQGAHLWRVGAWGLANAVGGAALVLASDRSGQPGRWAFGLQSSAWGTVNVGIAAVGLLAGPGEVTAEWARAFAAENGYADVLLLNLGLNVGYAAVGGTLLAVAGRGVPNPAAWRGHGAALVLQGAGLFVLDGLAYLGTRDRLGALADLAGRAELAASGAGVVLVVPL